MIRMILRNLFKVLKTSDIWHFYKSLVLIQNFKIHSRQHYLSDLITPPP